MPTKPPRWRTARRVATTPPGTTRRGRRDAGESELRDTPKWYEVKQGQARHLSDSVVNGSLAAAAVIFWLAIYWGPQLPPSVDWLTMIGSPAIRIGLILCACCACWKGRWFIAIALIVLCGAGSGITAWSPSNFATGPCSGNATLVTDPVYQRGGADVVLRLEGVRYRATATGLAGRRLMARLSGQHVQVLATCRNISSRSARFERPRHVVGAMTVSSVSENFTEGSVLIYSANRLRNALSRGARTLNDSDRRLFLGLVIGDDRAQPRSMVTDFRASGLSHLTAVSGQNVSYLLAVAGVFLTRRKPAMRLVLTLALLGWFVVLTRAEPSVLRAVMMAAAYSATFMRGITAAPRQILPCTVIVLLLIDPMLAHSVGFALSVGATAGLTWCAAPLSRLIGPSLISRTISITMAAQVGTAPIALMVFHRFPVISMIANPLAVPIAGIVMLAGIPCALLSAFVPDQLATFVMFPLAIAVRGVWWIAHLSSLHGPTGTANFLGWVVVVLLLGMRMFYVTKRHSGMAG